jgi:Hemerythrin HHE cation binding domain
MMCDLAELILAEHRTIRACFSTLSQQGTDLRAAAAAVTWRSLAPLLDRHTQAEEEIIHPVLWALAPEVSTAVLDAIADHGDIRETASEIDSLGHLTWEEEVVLPALCRSASPAARRKLGQQWTAFTGARAADARGLRIELYGRPVSTHSAWPWCGPSGH